MLYNQEVKDGMKLTFSFTGQDRFSGQGVVEPPVAPTGFSAGYTNLLFVTPLGAYVFEPRYADFGNRLFYPLVPPGIQGQYVAWVWLEDDQKHFLLTAKAFSGSSFTPTLAAPFSPSVDVSSALPRVSGLRATGVNLIGYFVSVSWKPDPSKNVWQSVNAFASAKWLGSQDAYNLPDLSSLGFSAARPSSGLNASYSAGATFSAQSVAEILAVSGSIGIIRTNTPNLDRKGAGVGGSYQVP
ncbi:hypothetical protein [Thermus sp.]|uniref:hypothetical protein n=1 Tax=Thermus sp. TaxID=275 RepID=UPI00321FF03C